jgi:mono/diheme cytochrome c family protein
MMNLHRKALFAVIISSGLASTAAGADGKALFLEKKCNTCHSVDSQSIPKTSKTMKGVDLSNASALVESADWAKSFLKREVKKDDKNHQREFKGTDEELNAIVDWLMTLKTS